ncbi:beta-propeller domain-containing protein [Actinocrispum sp. NPDC049592]|uniref:beta-propeller domain-containing protein n=1 Tax=Actinocrispum sp. NPDC049592 TaxID=3154835 RepID=UPI00341FE343
MAVAVVIGGIAAAAPEDAVTGQQDVVTDSPAAGIRLVAFDSCEKALNDLRTAALPYIGPFGFGGSARALSATGGDVVGIPDSAGAAQAPAAPRDSQKSAQQQESTGGTPGHSTTNTHEAGVDEPDIVKTDGKRLVSVADGHLTVIDVASRKVTGTLELPDVAVSEMLLSGDRALLVANRNAVVYDMPMPRGKPAPPLSGGMGSTLVLVDLAGAAKTVGTLSVDGAYIDARQVGAVARVVVRSQPQLRFVYPDQTRNYNSSLKENREIAQRSTIEDWLPRYQLDSEGTHSEGRLVDCERVSHPAAYSGTGMLTVLTIDLNRTLGTGDPVTIAADGDTVYGTGTSLYVADDRRNRYIPLRFGEGIADTSPAPAPPPPPAEKTQIHRFDIAGSGPPRYAGSGEVDGTLLNQYSLSEYNGYLRVATTTGQFSSVAEGSGARQSQSMITVLQRQENGLAQVGKVDGLGKGERIYAVRFFGAVGYVVTFRQMDPLYTVDLSQPARPRVAGELKITGYSAYLHPVGDNKILGVGQEASTQGRRLGAQVSLFDVGNAAAPNRTAQYQIEGGSSEVEYDPHAFLYWPARDLVVIPVTGSPAVGGKPQYQQLTYALVLRLDGAGLSEVGRVAHPNGMIRRSLVIGEDLWTVSDAGVMVNELGKLAQQAWIPLR